MPEKTFLKQPNIIIKSVLYDTVRSIRIHVLFVCVDVL